MTRRHKTRRAALVLVLLAGTAACRSTTAAPAPAVPDPTFSVSHWTDRTELFMEHPLLVAQKSTRMAVHLTTLADFRPLNEGRPAIELKGADGRVTMLPGTAPLRPGAFRVEGALPPAGKYTWGVRVQAGALTDYHDLGTITVFATEEAARSAPTPPEGAPAVAYLKEQQWTNPFATVVVRAEGVRRSTRVPATVTTVVGGEALVSAPAAGRLVANGLRDVGDRVSAGDVLARFEPRIQSIEDRALLVQQVAEASAAVQAAEVEQQRAERLLAEHAVPARRVEDARRARSVAQAQLTAAQARLAHRDETLRSGGAAAGGNTFDLRAPIAGTIVDVRATPGAAYEEGAVLFRIVRMNPVVVEAQVPASGPDLRGLVSDLALELPGRADLIEGRIRRESHAGLVDAASRALILRFEVDNAEGRLLVGQAGTAVLYMRERVVVPVVPAGAILTEAGRPFLFAQVGGERFEKRNVELGARDGDRVAVVAGLAPGDRVVTRGAYEVQLASAAKGLPAEGHVH